jgi:hypothetical protein
MLLMGGTPQAVVTQPVDAAVEPSAVVVEGPPVRPLLAFRSRTRRAELYSILQQHSLATGSYDSQGRYEVIRHGAPTRSMPLVTPATAWSREPIPAPVPIPLKPAEAK